MLLFFCKYRCFCAIKISANFGVSEEVRKSLAIYSSWKTRPITSLPTAADSQYHISTNSASCPNEIYDIGTVKNLNAYIIKRLKIMQRKIISARFILVSRF